MTEVPAETTPPAPTEQQVQTTPPEKPSRVRNFIASHPRVANAAKLTAAGLALVGVTRAVTNAQHNKERLNEGLDAAREAGDALTDSVTVNPDEN